MRRFVSNFIILFVSFIIVFTFTSCKSSEPIKPDVEKLTEAQIKQEVKDWHEHLKTVFLSSYNVTFKIDGEKHQIEGLTKVHKSTRQIITSKLSDGERNFLILDYFLFDAVENGEQYNNLIIEDYQAGKVSYVDGVANYTLYSRIDFIDEKTVQDVDKTQYYKKLNYHLPSTIVYGAIDSSLVDYHKFSKVVDGKSIFYKYEKDITKISVKEQYYSSKREMHIEDNFISKFIAYDIMINGADEIYELNFNRDTAIDYTVFYQ